MLGKFRGTLYGVLVGDCFGNLFQENSILSKGSRLVLRNFLDNLEKQQPNAAAGKQLFHFATHLIGLFTTQMYDNTKIDEIDHLPN